MTSRTSDYLLFYAKDISHLKYRKLYEPTEPGEEGAVEYKRVELSNGDVKPIGQFITENGEVKLPPGSKIFATDSIVSKGGDDPDIELMWEGKKLRLSCKPNRHWKPGVDGIIQLWNVGRLLRQEGLRIYKRYFDDFPYKERTHVWTDMRGEDDPDYVVQTSEKVIERCLLMTTDPGDLVFDPTCGSGTTAYVAEQWGRRWITCDTSRVSITLAKQRLMTALYNYYELAHPDEGVGSGFKYKTVPHVTLRSIANNPEIEAIAARFDPEIDAKLAQANDSAVLHKIPGAPWTEQTIPQDRKGWKPDDPYAPSPGEAIVENLCIEYWNLVRQRREAIERAIQKYADQETLYDQPFVDNSKARVTGPFTVEAVPFLTVKPLDFPHSILPPEGEGADESVARSGETRRQAEWRDELLKTGVRAKAGQMITFSRVEPLAGCRWLHADAETRPNEAGAEGVREPAAAYGPPARAVISFGPEHGPLEQRQVELAWEEARTLKPAPQFLIFCAFHFDPEAAKDIDELTYEKTGVHFLKVQMNTDLLTDDLKKKRSSNQSFWLIGQPDVALRKMGEGDDAGKYEVEVNGFDYYNTKTGGVDSGGTDRIAMWMLDTDYDGRSLLPRQVFFPMAGEKEGWARLARNLKAEIDPDLIEAYRGTVSLPFEPGGNGRVAVKIVDDRGIESLKIIKVE